jgi:hypothetical protein
MGVLGKLYGVLYAVVILLWALSVMFDKTYGGVTHFCFMMAMIFLIILDIKRRSPGYSI